MRIAPRDPPKLSDDPYVLAYSGKVFEFYRAAPFMDQELLEKTRTAMYEEQTKRPRWDATYGVQWLWDYYCERHREKYAEPFVCDVSPDWDH